MEIQAQHLSSAVTVPCGRMVCTHRCVQTEAPSLPALLRYPKEPVGQCVHWDHLYTIRTHIFSHGNTDCTCSVAAYTLLERACLDTRTEDDRNTDRKSKTIRQSHTATLRPPWIGIQPQIDTHLIQVNPAHAQPPQIYTADRQPPQAGRHMYSLLKLTVHTHTYSHIHTHRHTHIQSQPHTQPPQTDICT